MLHLCLTKHALFLILKCTHTHKHVFSFHYIICVQFYWLFLSLPKWLLRCVWGSWFSPRWLHTLMFDRSLPWSSKYNNSHSLRYLLTKTRGRHHLILILWWGNWGTQSSGRVQSLTDGTSIPFPSHTLAHARAGSSGRLANRFRRSCQCLPHTFQEPCLHMEMMVAVISLLI